MKTRVGLLLLSGALVTALVAGLPHLGESIPAEALQSTDNQVVVDSPTSESEEESSDLDQPAPTEQRADEEADGSSAGVTRDEGSTEELPEENGVAGKEVETEDSEMGEAPSEISIEKFLAAPPMTREVSRMADSTWKEQKNQRLSGSDRYATAVSISKHAYPDGASTVILATGLDYPDALSAAALGAKIQAPLLLTDPKSLPSNVKSEINRLRPSKLIIVGGIGAVGANIEKDLRSSVASVQRLSGSTRYETSAAIAVAGWKTSNEAFVATGTAYADALSASAAAGKLGAPVILVPGNLTQAPKATLRVLSDLSVRKLRVAGGVGAVNAKMLSAVSAGGRTSVRYGGADRYETSAKIVNAVYSGSIDTYWASGATYADALSGAAAAGAKGAPLMLVAPTCVPSAVYDANDRVSNGSTYLLGGAGALTQEVLVGNECMNQPSGSTATEWKGAQKLYTGVNQARYAAGVSSARLYDPTVASPALAWSRGRSNTGAQLNGSLRKQQPWAQYQTVAQTSAGGDKAARLNKLISGNPNVYSWLVKPSGGMRPVLSVGYAVSGSKATGTILMGVKLK